MILPRPTQAALALAFAAVIIAQAARVLVVPPPRLALGDAHLLVPGFADPQCTAPAQDDARRVADKWSFHPGDGGATLRCVSAPLQFTGGASLLVRYAGDPGAARVRAGLDFDGDGAIDRPFTPGAPARHGWLLEATALPENARAGVAQVVVEDRDASADGWLVIRDLVQFDGRASGLDGAQPWRPGIAGAAAAILAALVLALALTGQRGLAALAAGALLAVEFLQMSTFYVTDDYVLLPAFADGVRVRDLVTYYDQFAPLFLAGYAGAVALARDWYAPLQLAMLAGHLAVSLVLARFLERHGFARVLAWSAALLYATSWSHVDVVPWFMEACFLASTGLTVLALERIAAGRPVAAVVAAALAPLVFAGGAVAPWLCLLYALMFVRRERVAVALFALVGVASVVLILAVSPALDSARAVATGAPPADVVMFVVRGALASSLASLLGLRGHFAVAAGLLVFAGAVVVLAGPRSRTGWSLSSLAFGAAWLVAAYALQAAVRTGTGFGEAMAFRYTAFGMTGAAFAVAAWLDPLFAPWTARERLRQLLACAVIAATIVAAGRNAGIFAGRVEREEREYFDIARQYFAVTDGSIRWAVAEQAVLPPATLPKTLLPGAPDPSAATLARYRATVCYLSGCAVGRAAQAPTVAAEPVGACAPPAGRCAWAVLAQ